MAWYKELFAGEDPARLHYYEESEKSQAEVTFIIEKLGLTPGMRVMDLCCGQGKHLVDFARRGYCAVGIELSDYMLDKCRENISREGLNAHIMHSDMREIDFNAEFDVVINMWTSFGYLESEEEDQKVLDQVARALKPSGWFVLDFVNHDSMIKRFLERTWIENTNGDLVTSERHYDPVTGRLHCTEKTLYCDGAKREISHSIRLYTFTELARMLKLAGMTVGSVWGGFDGSELTMDSKHVLVAAQRR